MQIEKLRNYWESARTSLWFMPAIIAFCAIVLAAILPEIDKQLGREFGQHRDWLFSGSPSAARTILSVIAGSLITVISLLFSITIIALQQASTQFTPRVFRNFTSDRGSQIVLGFYVATFLYALLVLRQVRDQDAAGGTFVPILSITVAIMLTLICLGLLIYFIHHSSSLLRASTVIERIHRELLLSIDELYPANVGEPIEDEGIDPLDSSRRGQLVTATDMAGFLQSVDESILIRGLPGGCWVIVHPQAGQYITRDTPLVEIMGTQHALDDDQRAHLRGAFLLRGERTLSQDATFGVRQLVDIALKGLSPAINDPTTAEHAMSCLGDVLTKLVQRAMPAEHRLVQRDDEEGGDGPVVLQFKRPTFADFVSLAFNQIRLTARGDVHVMLHLLSILADIGRQASKDRAEVLRKEVEEILWHLERADLSPGDLQRVRTRASQAIATICE